ncbi:MAG: riboflavin synthase [Chloroflexi bacterium]|nr:riboflavin synthase [Chloroflexota bacterium]
MFTGIVEEIGTIKTATLKGLLIAASRVLEGTVPGDSIAVNGACLTVTSLKDGAFTVELMPETRRRTNLGSLRPGSRVNLERSLPLGGRIGGHLVQGHVDGMGKMVSLTAEADALLLRYQAPPEIMRYVVPRGFIAVDGVSLTVVDCDAASFTVSLVGYTRGHTSLDSKRPGETVNLEVDILAKYIERLATGDKQGITLDFMARHGFASS